MHMWEQTSEVGTGGWGVEPGPIDSGHIFPPTKTHGAKICNRKKHVISNFTQPLLDLPGTIMNIDENFLFKNALKVKFTLSLFHPRRTSLKFKKKIAAKRLQMRFFEIRFDSHTPTSPPPHGGPTVPTYALGEHFLVRRYVAG